jgi:hypothetical protein
VKGAGVFLLILLGALLVAAAALLAGVDPLPLGRDSTRLPCEQLPDRQTVADAIAAHQELVTRIERVGPGVTVEVATPCDDSPDWAIVRITYTTDAEREGVDTILRDALGFGVPVELVSD